MHIEINLSRQSNNLPQYLTRSDGRANISGRCYWGKRKKVNKEERLCLCGQCHLKQLSEFLFKILF